MNDFKAIENLNFFKNNIETLLEQIKDLSGAEKKNRIDIFFIWLKKQDKDDIEAHYRILEEMLPVSKNNDLDELYYVVSRAFMEC